MEPKVSRILVTGGAGYIGSVLVPMLLDAGHKVVVVDNFMYGQESLLDCCHDKNLSVIKGDVSDDNFLERIKASRLDFIIPLAAIVGMDACDKNPEMARITNLEAIRSLASLKLLPPVIFPNTNSGYGIGQKDIHCTEESPLNPVSLYGRLKVEAEKIVLSTNKAVVLRLATVFGISPRMRTDLLVNDLVQKAACFREPVKIYQPHFKRNYIHVRDVARAFMYCLDNFDRMRGQVYNLGLSNANLSKWELCLEIQKQVPDFNFFEGEGEDPDKRNYIVSNEKIERAGFRTQHSLPDGIAELVKGYTIIGQKRFSNI
jgi:nucleoside-diphosphate-sugar epimerase